VMSVPSRKLEVRDVYGYILLYYFLASSASSSFDVSSKTH
jgi:hypothetical protein